MKNKSKATQQRESIRNDIWPDEDAWTGEQEVGWFFAPRTLPLIIKLLGSKELSGSYDPTTVYLELWSRHLDGGVIVMASEEEHAFAAGYEGKRGVRSWQERMRMLEKLGFIKTHRTGNKQYKYVLLIHPTTAVRHLKEQKKVPDLWWNTYRDRQREAKEATYEKRQEAKTPATVALPKEVGASTRQPLKAVQGS